MMTQRKGMNQMSTKPTDFEIQFPTLLDSYEIANDLEAELQKELLPIYAKAKKAAISQLIRLQDLPPNTPLSSKKVQSILNDTSNAFKKEWEVPAFKVLSVYIKAGRNLGDITAEVILHNILEQERRS